MFTKSKYSSDVFPVKTPEQIAKLESFIDSLGPRCVEHFKITTNYVKVIFLR